MSYDLYCYKSKLGKPDPEEANSIIMVDNDNWVKKDRDASTKLAIVKAIVDYNQKLQATDFHYGDVTKLTVALIEKEERKFDHIVINDPDGEIAVELTVYDNHVFISLPFGYTGQQASQLFQDIKAYVNIINKAAGYFVWDPQSGETYDPKEIDFDGLEKYLSVSDHLAEIINGQPTAQKVDEKPWWKFW